MAASGNLEGHGRPNVFLAGEVGQIYKDLDSGLEYVCTGERGFIKVDGDDQSEMYNWELVESGGSTGGGAETFKIIFYNTNISGTAFASTKTFSELKDAIKKGLIIEGEYKNTINDVETNKLWLTSIYSDDGSEITGIGFFYLEYFVGEMQACNINFFSNESIEKNNIKLAVQ